LHRTRPQGQGLIRMKSSALLLFPILVIAAACGGSGAATEEISENAGQSAAKSNIPGNLEILGKVYDPDYSIPDGFFLDERVETTTRSYSLHHVLDESKSYELCTNDLTMAQTWEAADNASRTVNGYYVTSIENDRYFEFVRELEYTGDIGNVSNPTSPGYARVFKCNYADRAGVDRNLLDGYSGRLAVAPLGADTLREFVEYLWQFRFFNVSRKVVVASYGATDNAGLGHTLLLALVVNQGTGQCDRVDIVEWHFRIDDAIGEITREFDTVRSFESALVNGVPELCE